MSVNLDKEVSWGIIGAGYISRIAMKPAFENSKVSKLLSVASKDINRGKFLNPTGRVYTKYEDLLNDPDVEAIYIALPNSLHIEWSIKALLAGKHVLCEKPIACNAQELKHAISVADSAGLILVEASWNRWHPRTIKLKEIVDSGSIGKVKNINSAFTYDKLNPNNIRAYRELGGGSLYDLGPYSVAAPIWIMDFAPISNLKADVRWHPNGCDETVNLQFDIGEARAETLTSMNIEKTLILDVIGTNGRVQLTGNDAFSSHNQTSTLEIELDGKIYFEKFPACDPYQLMIDNFSRYIRSGQGWLMPHWQSLEFAKAFDLVFELIGRP